MCTCLCPTYWTTFSNAEKNRNSSCPMHECDPPIFWVFNSPPQRAMDPRGGRTTSADIVSIQIKFGVDPCTRCWDIAQKPPKCKNSPLTPIVTKISFPPFSARWGRQPPKGGEDTSHIQNQSTPACELWRESGPRVVEKSLTEQKKQNKTYSKTVIPRPSL